jgi:protein-S-isoprenylcysteine O-methyltransferase Ste14
MNYILLGTAGFLLMHLLDFASLKNVGFFKPVLSLCGTSLIVIAATMVATTGAKFETPVWASVAGWMLLIMSAGLTAYSLYGVLPLSKTYVEPGTSDQLVTEGVYALVRHPWLLFFTLSMVGLALASRSILAIEAGLAWTVFSVIMVYVQDQKILPRMFPGYPDYQKRTPMLLPNHNSVIAFIEGLKRNKVPEV